MTYARHQFELSEQQEDGSTVRDHLMRAWAQTGEKPDELADAPEVPASCEMLWSDFLELHSCRGSTGFGAMRITWRDLADWQIVKGVHLLPWEVDQIRMLDDMWLSDFAPKPKEAAQ